MRLTVLVLKNRAECKDVWTLGAGIRGPPASGERLEEPNLKDEDLHSYIYPNPSEKQKLMIYLIQVKSLIDISALRGRASVGILIRITLSKRPKHVITNNGS